MAFSDQTIQAVWNKGRTVAGYDPNLWRQDVCTAWMHRTSYGNRNISYGWEIDHIDANGGDDLKNLQPLQWQNNVAKGEGQLRCVVRSSGNQNV